MALVGKGITFDSGGLNIKPSAGMVTMKCDMAGAAAVAATVLAAAELGLPVAVTGYLCLAENMPSGTAQRPSDVVVMRNGTSVEILDTDAEGRMVLGDGLCLASEKHPDWVVDIATLTGAQVVALGTDIAGVMANDDAFRARVVDAAGAAGEGAWPMPLPVELRAKLDTPTADIAHKGDRDGGMLTAGLFLKEFVGEGIPWAHVDIAGPGVQRQGPQGSPPQGRHRLRRRHPAHPGGVLRRLTLAGRPTPSETPPDARLTREGVARHPSWSGGQPPLLRRNICCVALASGPWAWSTLACSLWSDTSAPPCDFFASSAARNFAFTSSSTAGRGFFGADMVGPSVGWQVTSTLADAARLLHPFGRVAVAHAARPVPVSGPWAGAGARSTGASARGSR